MAHHAPTRKPLGRLDSAVLVLSANALLLFAAGCSDPVLLEGVVEGPEGKEVAGLEILLFPLETDVFHPDEALAGTRTDSRGRFRLRGRHQGESLLILRGPEGDGRVRVENLPGDSSLSLSYPVVKTIVFLHDNDTHFNWNHREAFEGKVAELRQRYANVYLMSAGDIFIRHMHRWPVQDPEYYRERSRFMIESMNHLGYDLTTTGNHELDYVDSLTRESLEKARFPLLAANIEVATENLPGLEPYAVLRTDTRRSIAVLGLSVVNFQKEGVTGLDPIETTQRLLHLREGHDLFMALTHVGVAVDRRLAEEFPELDLIIGGHSHTLLEEGLRVGSVLIAQAGGVPSGHPVREDLRRYLGKVTVTLENGRVVDKRSRVLIFE